MSKILKEHIPETPPLRFFPSLLYNDVVLSTQMYWLTGDCLRANAAVWGLKGCRSFPGHWGGRKGETRAAPMKAREEQKANRWNGSAFPRAALWKWHDGEARFVVFIIWNVVCSKASMNHFHFGKGGIFKLVIARYHHSSIIILKDSLKMGLAMGLATYFP